MPLERISERAAELTGQVEQPRKQLADAEYELERLVATEQVVAQLLAEQSGEHPGDPAACAAERERCPGSVGFAVLVNYRNEAAGVQDLPPDYRVLVEAGPLPRSRQVWRWWPSGRVSISPAAGPKGYGPSCAAH